MTQRYEYFLDLQANPQVLPLTVAAELRLRAARLTDAHALAELMINAYQGTIDYDGESVEDAENEIQAYLNGERGGPALLARSRVACDGSRIVGACLVTEWLEKQHPLIAYVFTDAEWKNRGVGRQLLAAVLQELRTAGYQETRAVITKGNIPSERLFFRMGFQRIK